MSESLYINLANVKECLFEFNQIERRLKDCYIKITDVRNDLQVMGEGTHDIKFVLDKQINAVKKEADSIHEMKEVLEDIVRVYILFEAMATNNVVDIVSLFFDKMYDFIFDREKNVEDILRKLSEIYNKQDIFWRIKDEDTRNGFSEQYRNILQQIYDDVPSEYSDARKLYDKYSSEVVVIDFNSTDQNGKPTAYHSNGELHINTNEDINNMRGAGTTYYHEYGHFIVEQEGWVAGNVTKEEFKEFERSLRDEISAYINTYEEKYRQEGIDKKISGTKLERYIEDKTRKAISEDICGKNNEYCHINNGISDIIDGVSNDKYQPGYGHSDGYWKANQSRVPNEAFAQIFSAQMTGDEIELEKMKKIMPETYKLYCEMIKNASK